MIETIRKIREKNLQRSDRFAMLACFACFFFSFIWINFLLKSKNFDRFSYSVITDLLLASGLCIIAGVSGKARAVLYPVIVIVCLYGFVQTVYSQIFEAPFMFGQVSILREFFDVAQTAAFSISLDETFFFFPIGLLAVMEIAGLIRNFKIRQKPVYGLAAAVLILLCVVHYRVNCDNSKLSEVVKNGFESILFYDLDSSSRILSDKLSVSKEELSAFNDKYRSQERNEYSGRFEGKNLILILCESLDDFVISKEVTPTLYKMKEEGWYFGNYHAPLYPYHTVDSEFIVLTGQLPSLNYGVTNYSFSDNAFPSSLARLFRQQKNYSANSYHSFKGTYYNRFVMHESLGFESLFSGESMTKEALEMVTIPDEELFSNVDLDDAPFFKYVITLSTHGHYYSSRSDIRQEIQEIGKLYENDEINSYLATAKLLDKGLETLLNSLKESGHLDDTVIALFGDHVPYTLDSDEARSTVIKDDIVPFLIYSANEEAMYIGKPCSVEDVYPTLTNLFGLDTSQYYKAGIDIFSEQESSLIGLDESTDEKVTEIKDYSQKMLVNDFYKN